MNDLLPVFRDLKNIKCPLRRMRKKDDGPISSSAWNVFKKPRGTTRSVLRDVQQPNVWLVKECYDFTMSWHNWSALTTRQNWCYTSCWVLTGCCQKHCSNQTDYQVLSCSPKTNSFIKTHTFTNTHRVTNSANVRWCIKSSAGLAMPLRPGLCCQCKSWFRNLQAPVEHPNSLCSGVVSCKFLHHHPGAQTDVCRELTGDQRHLYPPQVFRG